MNLNPFLMPGNLVATAFLCRNAGNSPGDNHQGCLKGEPSFPELAEDITPVVCTDPNLELPLDKYMIRST